MRRMGDATRDSEMKPKSRNGEAKIGRHPDDKRGEAWAQREKNIGQRKTET